MKYRVTFRERNDRAGNPTEKPSASVEAELSDGVVQDAVFVERFEPDSLHGEDKMEEDDDFLSLGTEVWEYDIADGRDQEFIDALRNSEVAIEYEALDNMPEISGV
jgi:hypothetical protein